MSILGQNIKHLAELYGLSLREISRRAGIPDAITSKTVRGLCKPRQASVEKIAKVFNMDAKTLQMSLIADTADPTTAEERRAAVRPATPSCHVEPDVLLDDEKRAQAWETAVAVAREEGDEPMLTAYMPTDDLAPVVPRGALLYLTVEPYPDKPRLEPDAPAVGVVALDNGGRALVLGTPSVSLGRITLKTASGQSVPVDRIVAYVEGWAVFRRHRQP